MPAGAQNVPAGGGGGAGGYVSAAGSALESIIGGAFNAWAQISGREAEHEILRDQAAYGRQTILEEMQYGREAAAMRAEEEAAMREAEQTAREALTAAQAEALRAEQQREVAARRAAREAMLTEQARRIYIPTWGWALIVVGGIGATFGVVAWLARKD
jgi:hypothetical protein